MSQRARRSRAISAYARAWLAAVACLLATGPAWAQAPSSVPIFRLYLQDGSTLVSYGEYTDDGKRVTVPVPIGPVEAPDGLQVVTVPSSAIDWTKTRAHSDLVKYTHYAATRGEREYLALTDEVARALTEISTEKDAATRLAMARQTRALAADWPRTRFGYRSAEVRDLVGLLDEAILAAQADQGVRSFAFDLVTATQPPSGSLPPEPTIIDTLESARAAARAADVPEERMALQQAILAVLSRRSAELPPAWVTAVRSDIEARQRTDALETRAYVSLRSSALRAAGRAAARGNVAGVERAIARAHSRDAELGQRRPNEMEALAATLGTYLDMARRRRLEMDRWSYRVATHKPYRAALQAMVRQIDKMRSDIDAIRSQSGPAPARLQSHTTTLAAIMRKMAALTPPDDFRSGHDTMTSALRLHAEALRLRADAIRRADPALAADASAAAAGARLLFDGARETFRRYFQRPDRL